MNSFRYLVEDEKPRDCKRVAIETASLDAGLHAVRGHVVLDGRFFAEHWWCRTRSGALHDPVLGQSHVEGVSRVSYVELPGETGGYEDAPFSGCLARTGPCEEDPICPWCAGRYALEERRLVSCAFRVEVRPVDVDLARLDQMLRRELPESLRREGRDAWARWFESAPPVVDHASCAALAQVMSERVDNPILDRVVELLRAVNETRPIVSRLGR